MTVQEAIKKNISECKRRIFRIKDFLENDKGANIDKCKDNIFVLETTIQALEEIEQYRALEEQGLLLKLHCKVGDTVYIIAPKYKDCHNTYNCDDFDSDRYFITWCKDYCPNGYDGIGVLERKVYGFETIHNDVYAKVNSFGIKKLDEVFLTKEEAEAKLKELEGK